MEKSVDYLPHMVFEEYKMGNRYKESIGDKGLQRQAEINGRFYVGDHWYGAKCGNDRPLVRRNIIRRIADYKLASIGAAPVAVNFSAEGVPDSLIYDLEHKDNYPDILAGKNTLAKGIRDEFEIATAMQLLTGYGQITMERLKFNTLLSDALRNAYISGTGIIYTYWDELCETGLYADDARSMPIKGDIACEVVDVENIVFGDPDTADVQKQPYIIIASRRDISDVVREAKKSGRSLEEIEKIRPDNDYGIANSDGNERVTVLTKFYKQWDEKEEIYRVMCVRCVRNAVIKEPFDIGINSYPVARLVWDSMRSSAYGESEITYMIPNQIAINRALSAEVWSTMLTGMPIMLQNGDIISQDITNDPGQIIKVYGSDDDISRAISYVEPPAFAEQMLSSINDLAKNTLSDSGANDAALGNIRPDNAAAIIQVREAALQPMQLKQNQYYAFIEDVMRIWAQFWVHFYGERKLKIRTPSGTSYIPFDAGRYSDLLINARVDVGASTVWSTAVVVSTLGELLTAGIITPIQYLERLPAGIIPDKTGLIEELRLSLNREISEEETEK